MLEIVDEVRKSAVVMLDSQKRGELGQFMTPAIIARFLASRFIDTKKPVHILDAGAGVGSLCAALLENELTTTDKRKKISLTAYEIDTILLPFLKSNISKYQDKFSKKEQPISVEIQNVDFISSAVAKIKTGNIELFTHAILNPPYKKINSNSEHRKLLNSIGFETVNLYSAFTGLAIKLLKDGGQLVAIIPRSFCNGNYYKSFRRLIIDNTAIKQIHLFEARNKAFKEDSVLQENIVIHLIKGQPQGEVIISRSTDDSFDDLVEYSCSFEQIVKPSDTELFIHIPKKEKNHLDESLEITKSLADLEISVSTGPVVDFRVKDYLYQDSVTNSVPLLYPIHFNGTAIDWPKQSKKPNAIALNENTRKMLYPNGYYTVVRRFSSKEEKQRIVARVIDPNDLNADYIGIENHLNVFHWKKQGLSENLAYGLAAYLNSSFVDTHFRSFNGHTQVNATDLRQMKYPSKLALIELGKWAKTLSEFNQSKIDKKIEKLL